MKRIKFILAAIAFLACTNSFAQTATMATGYFTDGFVYKNKLNPALVPNYSYFSFPVLNLGVSTSGNIAMNDLFVIRNGSMTSILNSSVSYADAINHLPAITNLNSNLDLNLISVGFFNSKGTIFTNIELGARVNLYSTLPKDVFAFAKGPAEPTSSVAYNMSGTNVAMTTYTQIAFGQSYTVAKKFRVGYKLRLLMGAASAEMDLTTLNASYDNNQWTVDSKGNLYTEPLYFRLKDSQYQSGKKVIDFTKPTFPGGDMILGQWIKNLGFSGDLGITYDPLDWVQVSAAVQDLGFITYKNQYHATSNHQYPAQTTQANVESTPQDDVKDFFNKLGSLTEFEYKDNSAEASKEKRTEMLPCILRGGVQVRIPSYKQISFGLLASGQIHNRYSWWETRASFNYDVVRWFSFSASYAYGTFSHQLGALVNFHTKGFNFYFGADNIPFQYSAQGVPLATSTTMVNVGINFLLGKYHGRYPKADKASK